MRVHADENRFVAVVLDVAFDQRNVGLVVDVGFVNDHAEVAVRSGNDGSRRGDAHSARVPCGSG